MYTIKDLYDLNEAIAAKLFEGKTYPWEVLADIGDFIMKLGPTLPKNEFNQIEDNIWVHKTVKIAPTASLTHRRGCRSGGAKDPVPDGRPAGGHQRPAQRRTCAQ